MKTTTEIIEHVGKHKAADALGVNLPAIRAQIARGKFPAAWYDTLERLCGHPLDRNLFAFKGKTK